MLEEVLAQIKIAVMAYPLKAMAADLGKPYSTLANELEHRDYAKLGFLTTLRLLQLARGNHAPQQSKEASLSALDKIDAMFGRVAFNIPCGTTLRISRAMRLISKLSKEFSEAVHELAESIDDGVWTREEIKNCIRENQDLLRACLEIDFYLKNLDEEKA